jgi:hypothetical protein
MWVLAVKDFIKFESGEGAWTREGEHTFMKVVADAVSVYELKHFKNSTATHFCASASLEVLSF